MPHAEKNKDPDVVYYHAGGVPGSRPVLTGAAAKPTFSSIPLIDMTGMFSTSIKDRQQVAKEVGKACSDVGFFYAQHHSVPQNVIDETFDAIASFFGQDHETKMRTHIDHSDFFRGYEPWFETKLDPETRGDLKESFTMGEDGTDVEQQALHPPEAIGGSVATTSKNNWPADNPDFRRSLYCYYAELLAFSRQLLHVFALALDLPEDHFDGACRFPMTAIRALHYPPQEPQAQNVDVGIGAHTDYSYFTLVCQEPGVTALQVLNDNGVWVDAPPVPRTFVVNIGDFLMQATGGVFQSTVHRVVNLTGRRRISCPFFFMPDEDAIISVIPGFEERGRGKGEQGQEQSLGMTVGQYFRKRLFHARYKHPKVVKWRQEMEARGEVLP